MNRVNRNPNIDLSANQGLAQLVSDLEGIGTNVPTIWKLFSRIEHDLQETGLQRKNPHFTGKFARNVLEVFDLFYQLYHLQLRPR